MRKNGDRQTAKMPSCSPLEQPIPNVGFPALKPVNHVLPPSFTVTPSPSQWIPAEPSVDSICSEWSRPLDALAAADVPALIIRKAWSPEKCVALVQKMVDAELLYDPHLPIPDKFIQASIPEGYFREGNNGEASQAWEAEVIKSRARRRIDIGTSLGYRGSNQEEFFAHSEQTVTTFSDLFADGDSPIEVLYNGLTALSVDKQAVTAYEPDGRRYGPAIIRAHYGGYTYAPHFDSVRLREKRENYQVYHFDHQFAGVLVLQNTHLGDQSAQCVLHRCLWEPDVDPWLKKRRFSEYAAEQHIENVEVVLEPGDLYFFNTRCIHEVPGVAGDLPRIVLATFIGYSSDREEIFVWS